MDLKELYETDERFRGYVDRYAKHHEISTEEALLRADVREYAKYLAEEGEINGSIFHNK